MISASGAGVSGRTPARSFMRSLYRAARALRAHPNPKALRTRGCPPARPKGARAD